MDMTIRTYFDNLNAAEGKVKYAEELVGMDLIDIETNNKYQKKYLGVWK